jgi:hypothetical protein
MVGMDGEHATIERDGSVMSGHKGSHMTAPTQRSRALSVIRWLADNARLDGVRCQHNKANEHGRRHQLLR